MEALMISMTGMTSMSTFAYTNDYIFCQTLALLCLIFSIILQVPQFIVLWSFGLVIGRILRSTMLAWICAILFMFWCNHQLPGSSWLLSLVSNFGFGLFLMIFLAKCQDAGIGFPASCYLICRAVQFMASTWTRLTWLLLYHCYSISGPLLLGVLASFLLFLLLFELGSSL